MLILPKGPFVPWLPISSSAHSAFCRSLFPHRRRGHLRTRCDLSPRQHGAAGCWDPQQHCTLRAVGPCCPFLLCCQLCEIPGLMQCRQGKQAAPSVSLWGLSWWKSIRLNFNSFSVSVHVPSKGHSYLSINSALCCKIGIQRVGLNFFHPLLLLCLCGAYSWLSAYPHLRAHKALMPHP